jgi:YfiH family protein
MFFFMSQISALKYPLFQPYPEIIHGVFLRHGGVSLGPIGSLNVGGSVGDDLSKIQENRARISSFLNIPSIVYAKQTHGTSIHRVTREDLDQPQGWNLLRASSMKGMDALFTTEKNIGLSILHADCQAAIFYDPTHQALGMAHAGWRGSIQNIYSSLIEAMGKSIGTKPQDLLVSISPSLGPNHAEYKNYKVDFPQDLWRFQTTPNHFDFWEMSLSQLIARGVLKNNIEISRICTYSEKADYFSYRRDQITGRHATVAALQ